VSGTEACPSTRVFQADPECEQYLAAELGAAFPKGRVEDLGGLFLVHFDDASVGTGKIFWARNEWKEPFFADFASIGEAAGILRSRGRNWQGVLHDNFRRGALIQQKLPVVSQKKRPLLWTAPESQMGAWTLLGANRLLASANCSSPFPGGMIRFEEDREGPPSRAYLKLAEAFSRMRRIPRAGDRCLDAGASPGGWSWLLAKAGAEEVLACDRAPLDPRIAALPAVRHLKHDAFTLKPEELRLLQDSASSDGASPSAGGFDWLCCDAAVYPARLLAWVEKWLASGMVKNYVCTIKMQGCGDMDTVRRFARLGGEVTHLCHNKHELTWMYSAG
jgi:23S rRNA (cytidine2498-2'-O)-methyltransferase